MHRHYAKGHNDGQSGHPSQRHLQGTCGNTNEGRPAISTINVQKHQGNIDTVQVTNDDGDGRVTRNRRILLKEQRGHVRKAIHVVQQEMKETTNDIRSQLNQTMLKELMASMGVAESYSPPRTAKMAASMGPTAGWSMDTGTHDEDGRIWDVNIPEMRNKVARRVLRDKSLLLIGSPTCTVHSVMGHMDHARMAPEIVQERSTDASEHHKFATLLHQLQV